MKIKYFAFSIVLIVSTLSCKQSAMYNSSGCIVDSDVFNELKKQKAKIKRMSIYDYFSRDNKQPHCIFFNVSVIEWKDIKTPFNYVLIPMLKTSNHIYINAFYSSGKLRAGFDIEITEKYIEAAIYDFKKEYEQDLDKETLEEIESVFRYGIGSFVPNR